MNFSAQQALNPGPQQSESLPKPKKKSKSKQKGGTSLMSVFLVLGVIAIVVLQGVIILFMLRPDLLEGDDTQAVAAEVAALVEVDSNGSPAIAVISNADNLRAENAIHSEIYKDAKNGDYVLGYQDKMVIYRRESGEIIYEGFSPGQVLRNTQSDLTAKINALVRESELVSDESDENPELSIVSEVDTFKSRNSKFYADLEQDDVIAIYSEAGVIVIYRPDSGDLVNSGTYNVNIKE